MASSARPPEAIRVAVFAKAPVPGQVKTRLAGILGADRVLLVGVSGDGSTALGRFSTALRQCLTENFRADQRIELWRLAAAWQVRVERRVSAELWDLP